MAVYNQIGIMRLMRFESIFSRMVLHNLDIGKYTKTCFSAKCSRISHGLCSQKFAGVPFNISSYALLTHMIAHVCELKVGELIYTLGDYHIYKNHLAQVEELLSREPLKLPRLEIVDETRPLRGIEGLLGMSYQNVNLVGYQSHGKIAAAVAV